MDESVGSGSQVNVEIWPGMPLASDRSGSER